MSKQNRSLHSSNPAQVSAAPQAEQPKVPAPKPEATLDEIKKLIAQHAQATHDCIKKLSGKFEKQDGTLSDHEKRIKALEGHFAASAPQENPAPQAKQPQQNPNPQEAQLQTAQQEKPAPQPVDPKQQKPAPGPAADACSLNAAYNGLGKAFRYWDYKNRTYKVVRDIWAAKQAGNGVYDVIWVWYNKGAIDHILTDEEITIYCP